MPAAPAFHVGAVCMIDLRPSVEAWQAAYRAFEKCAGGDGGDTDVKLRYSIAWTAAMEAALAFHAAMTRLNKET